MNNQVLSIEQMQELIELGIDTSKASMLWYPKMAIDTRTGKGYVESHYLTINHIDNEHFWNTREGKETIPTFTLQDIIEMLPNWIDPYYKYQKSLFYDVYINRWICSYVVSNGSCFEQFEGDSILEVAFNMLKWCNKNDFM